MRNNIIISMDKGEVIDHATLTDRSFDWYGRSGQAQIWFYSHLQNRHQFVKIKDSLSDKVTLSYGVPRTGLCAETSAFYLIHYTTQRY